MAKVNGYQGWASWETWNVAFWLNNDDGRLYDAYRAEARLSRFTATTARQHVQRRFPDGTPDFWGEGNASRYDLVDWQEIADDFNDGLEDE